MLLAVLLLGAARSGSAGPLLLGGLLPTDEGVAARWPWAGAWVWPVGSPIDFAQPSPGGEPAWRVLRGFSAAADSGERHRGVDLGNGRPGDPVHASAHGLVVTTSQGAGGGGFGCYVVLAHRLGEGGITYSVYSHLLPSSIRVCEGQCVWAGQMLARVGHSGRASTDHLHFEVRLADDPGLRWERTRAIDPLAFIARRLPAHLADTTWAGPYLDWAERAGLIRAGARASDALSRDTWQIMLSRAATVRILELPRDAPSLREVLIEAGVLPDRERAPLDRAPAWREMARDLTRLLELGTRLPPGPLEAPFHRAICLARLGREYPAHDSRDLRRATPPTVADACLLLADVAASEPPAPPSGASR